MNEIPGSDRNLRQAVMQRLYRAFLEDGLYRGVVSKKSLAQELGTEGIVLERNLEYLLDRGVISMHKIEDLISITTKGIDWIEHSASASSTPLDEIDILKKIEKLLKSILENLKSR